MATTVTQTIPCEKGVPVHSPGEGVRKHRTKNTGFPSWAASHLPSLQSDVKWGLRCRLGVGEGILSALSSLWAQCVVQPLTTELESKVLSLGQ